MTKTLTAMLALILAQALEAFSPRWRWREDDGDVYLATCKDSMNCPITYRGEANLRLRKGCRVSGPKAIRLCYTNDPYVLDDDSVRLTPVTASDTGMFSLSDSRFLTDGARYSSNMLLNNWDSINGPVYRGTVTIDTSSQYYFEAGDDGGFEIEYCLKPDMARIPAGSTYYFLSSRGDEDNEDPACIRFPPLYWTYHKERMNRIEQVQFVDSLNGWYVGYEYFFCTLWRTRDGGRTWRALTRVSTYPIFFVNRTIGWAVVNNRLSRTTDGGETWAPLDSVPHVSTNHPTSIYFLDTMHGWLACQDFNMLRTSNGGATWEIIGSPSGSGWELCFINERVGFCMGESFYKTTDGGLTWNPLLPIYDWDGKQSGTSNRFPEKRFQNISVGGQIQFADPSEGWVLLRNKKKLYHTTDGGDQWTLLAEFSDVRPVAFYFSDREKGWLVGYRGVILATKDGGKTWERRPSGTGHDLLSMAGVKDNIWIGCYDGSILSSETGGWTTAIEKDRKLPLPEKLVLYPNYPNPFNPQTTIRYALPGASHVTITIFDMLGREVSMLVNEQKPAGEYEVSWSGARCASGVYLCRMQTGSCVLARMMVLVK